MIGAVLEGAIEIIFGFIVEVFLFSTGEIILYILTLGKRTPTWKRGYKEHVLKTFIFIDVSVLLGFFFWILAIAFIVKKLI